MVKLFRPLKQYGLNDDRWQELRSNMVRSYNAINQLSSKCSNSFILTFKLVSFGILEKRLVENFIIILLLIFRFNRFRRPTNIK
ncbi:hypothetical protein BLA29_009612 [Euroglyphus maynei]|uniref:Uncharacterized protein n=1 Tax=Euroglyphus maynei TaxID=6958 RepID=A0A1Y3BMX6_EURMA|nr:hypothetical protein BLA29_009612 [Euroglyphus maynei]